MAIVIENARSSDNIAKTIIGMNVGVQNTFVYFKKLDCHWEQQ